MHLSSAKAHAALEGTDSRWYKRRYKGGIFFSLGHRLSLVNLHSHEAPGACKRKLFLKKEDNYLKHVSRCRHVCHTPPLSTNWSQPVLSISQLEFYFFYFAAPPISCPCPRLLSNGDRGRPSPAQGWAVVPLQPWQQQECGLLWQAQEGRARPPPGVLRQQAASGVQPRQWQEMNSKMVRFQV